VVPLNDMDFELSSCLLPLDIIFVEPSPQLGFSRWLSYSFVSALPRWLGDAATPRGT